MNPNKIVLVGMPGSGKSTLGVELAKQLGFSFYDLDTLIEQREKSGISDIFSAKGEGYFRKLESAVLKGVLLRDESFILATGGGAPCFNENMALINEHGLSVYLDVPLNQILNRLTSNQIEIRPLFAGLETGEIILKLKNMYFERQKYYEKAIIKLRGEDISTELLISEWMRILKIKS
ncbi:shikimate kinase [Negadavirga shengliensis]|uniref:Shikimate kinase n=1 Tax=Negadavirga shengliensis TaxID=1389218 RepID=A0ABV9T5K3_9BACT